MSSTLAIVLGVLGHVTANAALVSSYGAVGTMLLWLGTLCLTLPCLTLLCPT